MTCGPMGCERTQANEEKKKKKKQFVTEDKTEDADKIVKDSGKKLEQG